MRRKDRNGRLSEALSMKQGGDDLKWKDKGRAESGMRQGSNEVGRKKREMTGSIDDSHQMTP